MGRITCREEIIGDHLQSFGDVWIEKLGKVEIIELDGYKGTLIGRQAIATADAIFERVRVKSSSPSTQVLRAKTLEADNLGNSMPMASAGRYVTQAYSVRRPDGHFQATPSTGRIGQRGDRGDYEFAVAWTATVIDHLAADGGAIAPFIRNFARQLDLENLSADTRPVLFAIDVPQLTELLLAEEPAMRLIQAQVEAAF